MFDYRPPDGSDDIFANPILDQITQRLFLIRRAVHNLLGDNTGEGSVLQEQAHAERVVLFEIELSHLQETAVLRNATDRSVQEVLGQAVQDNVRPLATGGHQQVGLEAGVAIA